MRNCLFDIDLQKILDYNINAVSQILFEFEIKINYQLTREITNLNSIVIFTK